MNKGLFAILTLHFLLYLTPVNVASQGSSSPCADPEISPRLGLFIESALCAQTAWFDRGRFATTGAGIAIMRPNLPGQKACG
ncbi:MAG TPA: hypothetical protein VNW23_06465 [Opitutaceae bacterium]|jgi:hypothetical protein|nr:hypothetical protein [Opitutaceae bacterium]